MTIRSSSSLLVLNSALTIFTSTTLLGLDYARLEPVVDEDLEGDNEKNVLEIKDWDASDKTFVAGMALGALLFIMVQVPLRKLRPFLMTSQLSLAATAIIATGFSPGFGFMAFRAIQGAVAANAITLSLVSVAQISTNNSAWRFVPLSTALYCGAAIGIAYSADFRPYSAAVVLAFGCLALAALTWLLRYEPELQQGASSFSSPDSKLEIEHSTSPSSLKETLRHVPQFGQNIIRMFIVAFAMCTHGPYMFAFAPSLSMPDDQLDKYIDRHHNRTGSFSVPGQGNLTNHSYNAQSEDDMADMRYATRLFFILGKLFCIVAVPTTLECLGAYAVKRWNIRYNAPIALLFLLPTTLLLHIAEGGSVAMQALAGLLALPVQFTVSYLMRIYTPMISKLNASCYLLSNPQKTQVFASITAAFSLGLLLCLFEVRISTGPFWTSDSVLLLIIAAADFVPDVVSKIKRD